MKEANDLWIYILLQSMSILIAQVITWIFIFDKINIKKIALQDIFKHLYPSLQYFIPKIAIILYTNMNKTLLGWLDSKNSVGYYANTLIINGVLVTLVTTLDLVLLPKFSNLVSKGKNEDIVKAMKKQSIFNFFTIPMMFGLWEITPKFVPWFFGEKFLLLLNTIPFVAPLIVIIPLGMAVGRQYLVPMNRIRVYNIAVILGAVVSIISNLLLIPVIGIYGAIISTILAELFVTTTRFTSFVRETSFRLKLKILLYIFYLEY
ncbi:lipopolysaccharide biosynthesis protein [Enterococcus faecium]|uniref:lipopolysaccharide biosynthesis protein n=1 Tax=Enterococcus faecium TaxID=1352 RepID=UPI0022404196|nr:polysaccharide biosynthesis C-terminal domain-containing protein [Enterococcus faecium]